jgi:hypothetical protein
MLWILYRIEGGKVKFLGVYPSEKIAKDDIAALEKVGAEWELASVLMVGWSDYADKPAVHWLKDRAQS